MRISCVLIEIILSSLIALRTVDASKNLSVLQLQRISYHGSNVVSLVIEDANSD
jgi:hypothetical protein